MSDESIYQLTGDATRIRQVVDHFLLRVDKEHSTTKVDVLVDEEDEDDVQSFCDSIGIHYREL